MSANEIWDYFDGIETYPRCIAERGVPQGGCYTYVSSTFLNGFINYVKPFYVAMIERYNEGWLDEEEYKKKVLAELEGFHTKYNSRLFDDIFILAESDDQAFFEFSGEERSYWFFWSDRDCSDCAIGRFSIEGITKEDLIEALKYTFKVNHPGEGYQIGEPAWERTLNGKKAVFDNLSKKRFMELPMPKGWVSF